VNEGWEMEKMIIKCDTVFKMEPNIEGYKEGTWLVISAVMSGDALT
jgi:hypothetical protein